jgi:hypothetical protein
MPKTSIDPSAQKGERMEIRVLHMFTSTSTLCGLATTVAWAGLKFGFGKTREMGPSKTAERFPLPLFYRGFLHLQGTGIQHPAAVA